MRIWRCCPADHVVLVRAVTSADLCHLPPKLRSIALHHCKICFSGYQEAMTTIVQSVTAAAQNLAESCSLSLPLDKREQRPKSAQVYNCYWLGIPCLAVSYLLA